ncbi:MAG: Mu-like prophage major head subunit gpT family protein [Candidatus Marinimicrobia bacterium]|nr:Mu-like prophage major head subunit gpT family protein [Candidatus Neomarinimicrobiota bacterium]
MATGRISDIPNLILAGISEVFNAALQKQYELMYPAICREVMEEKQTGIYQTIGALGSPRVHREGSAIIYDKIGEDHQTTIVSQWIEMGVSASIPSIEFDLYNVVEATFGEQLVTRMIQYKEELVADAYNDMFTDTGADGVALASASHPLCNSSLLNDNLATGALTTNNFKAAANKFNSIYDQGGKPIKTRPTHLAIHPNKMFEAVEILGSSLLAMELSNTMNSVSKVAPVTITSNVYFDYDDSGATPVSPWFLLDKGLPKSGCVLQKHSGLRLKAWEEDEDFTYKGVARECYGVGITTPGYGIVASTGA